MTTIDVNSRIQTHLTRANTQFDNAIAALSPTPAPRPMTVEEQWAAIGEASRQIMSGLAIAVHRASIALPVLVFGSPAQKQLVEAALRGDNHA